MTTANGIKGESETQAALHRCWCNTRAAIELLTQPPRIAGSVWPLSLRQSVIAGTVLLAVILLLMLFVDAPTAKAATHLPHWFIWLFDQITDYGKSGWFLWPLGLVFLALAALPTAATRISQAVLTALMARVGFLFLAIGAPGLFVTTIKRMIGRARPMVDHGPNPFEFKPFIWHAAYASMPSGHATTAFSVLVAFGTLWPRARTVLLLYALVIMASRIIVTAHYPSDVLAGAVVGTVGALMVRRYFALRRLGFSITPEGRVHELPGPSLRRLKAVARELLAP
jgi:membrane-associated phospholipid phosphatase